MGARFPNEGSQRGSLLSESSFAYPGLTPSFMLGHIFVRIKGDQFHTGLLLRGVTEMKLTHADAENYSKVKT